MNNSEFKKQMQVLCNISKERTFKAVEIADRIDDLVIVHGSLRTLGELLDIDYSYLSRLRSGDKDDPSDAVLSRLGLKRTVIYERLK